MAIKQQQKKKKQEIKTYWLKEKNKTIPICRWYDGLHKKHQGIYKKWNNWVQQGYKRNRHKGIAFLHTGNKYTETKE